MDPKISEVLDRVFAPTGDYFKAREAVIRLEVKIGGRSTEWFGRAVIYNSNSPISIQISPFHSN